MAPPELALMRWGNHALAWGRETHVMAIVNVTPDSFSGDGVGANIGEAVARAEAAVRAGAAIIDLGGESTRPGHTPIEIDAEIARVVPAIHAIAKRIQTPISIDTSKAAVAEAAIVAGASIVNDVRGLVRDPEMATVIARYGLPAIVMHDGVPEPGIDLMANILRELSRRVEHALAAGIAPNLIVIDPGFGFGKDWRQNLEILRRLRELEVLGLPILVGLSRKTTIGRVLGLAENDRLEGTLATTALAIANGADIVRVHDVLPNVRVARLTDAVMRGAPAEPCSWLDG